MALTIHRLIPIASAAAFIAIASLARPSLPESRGFAPEVTRLRDVQRRVNTVTNRIEALTRRDSIVRMLPSGGTSRAELLLMLDPRLPAPHRSLVERAVKRQWTSLRIGTPIVPVVVAMVVDTVMTPGRLQTLRGEYAFDYVLPTSTASPAGERCMVIVSLHTRDLVSAEKRAFSELFASPTTASRLLGPCAFVARFGAPGSEIAYWLRSRDYDLAAFPRWYALPVHAGEDMAERWRVANTNNTDLIAQAMWLSPEATGCAAGGTEHCASTILASRRSDTAVAGSLVMMDRSRDPHWSVLAPRYLSDLVTALGPDDFARFWRSTVSPDAALMAVAGRPLDVWTAQWAVGLIGEQHVGPAVSFGDVAGAITLAALSLMIAAWGWSRRQVR